MRLILHFILVVSAHEMVFCLHALWALVSMVQICKLCGHSLACRSLLVCCTHQFSPCADAGCVLRACDGGVASTVCASNLSGRSLEGSVGRVTMLPKGLLASC